MCKKNVIKFSVLMSVYIKENPDFLDLSLKSVLVEQSLIPNELVIICDGELTKELNEIIYKYQNQFKDIVKVYGYKDNRGLGKALNYGLEKCTFDYVARHDSDDVCAYNRFEKQIEFFENNQDISVLGTFIDEFDKDYNRPLSIKKMPTTNDKIIKYSKSRNPINHMTVMFKKDKVIESGSYIDLKYMEDYYLWIRMINHGIKFHNLDMIGVHARVGNGMFDRRGKKGCIKSRKVIGKYMLDNRMINKFTYLKNITLMITYTFVPSFIKKATYKILLRNKEV